MKNVVKLYIYTYDNHIEYVTNDKTEFIDYLDDEIIIDRDDLQNGYNSTLNDINNCILGVNKEYKELHQLKCIDAIIKI